jgi:purine-cytosine permease-like protein
MSTLALPWLMLAYAAASLLHFLHNALYVRDYPQLPAWLTASGVCAAWLALTLLGATGYGLYRRRSQPAGLALIGVYALLGFGGLGHYLVAPPAAHSAAMNATILIEALAAAALLAGVMRASWVRRAPRPSSLSDLGFQSGENSGSSCQSELRLLRQPCL